MKHALLVIATLASLSACNTPADTHHRPGFDHATATAPPQTHLRATLMVAAGRVEPPATWLDVPVGATVTLSITSDTALTVEADGESLGAVPAGQATEVIFVPDRAGVFELRTSDPALVLAQVNATG